MEGVRRVSESDRDDSGFGGSSLRKTNQNDHR